MDPMRLSRDQASRSRPQSFTPQTVIRLSSPQSFDDEDPLSSPSLSRLEAPKASTPKQSRIAVVLKASPSKQHTSSWPHPAKNGSVTAGIATSHPSSQAKKETPVPLPVQVGSPTTTPAIKSGVRGRPKGWKPGMSYSASRGSDVVKSITKPKLATAAAGRSVRQVKPRPPPSGYTKRRGRPPKAPSPPPWQIYQGLQKPFVAFLCEWEGCKAELHNLDTLRRHIYVVHSYDGPIVCLWGKCGRKSSHDALPNTRMFRVHMEEEHLVPLSWHVGDGPQNSGGNDKTGDKEVPDFLKDADGNQVTPSIRDQEVEDFATWKNNRRKLKELLIRMNENLPSEESDNPEDDG